MIGFTFYLLSVIMMASGFYITRYNGEGKLSARYLLVLLLWTAYIIGMVESGVFTNLAIPFIPILIVIPAISIILYSTSRNVFKIATNALPLHIPVYLQSFRILVEWMIFGTYLEGILPASVTFRGSNLDMLVGLSALVVGAMASRRKISPKGILTWNVLSLLILALTISGFARFIYFSDAELTALNMRFLEFPYILLPSVLVPFALYFHTISIRQCMALIRQESLSNNISPSSDKSVEQPEEHNHHDG